MNLMFIIVYLQAEDKTACMLAVCVCMLCVLYVHEGAFDVYPKINVCLCAFGCVCKALLTQQELGKSIL